MMKTHFSVFTILAAFILILSGCINNEPLGDDIEFSVIRGEVFVRMTGNATYEDLVALAERLEIEVNRKLGNGYVLNVPEGYEALWSTRLQQDSKIREAQFNNFGYSYRIASDDSLTYVDGDSIYVQVSYSGCDAGHAFTLESPVSINLDSSMDLWLFKSTEDEDCDAVFIKDFVFPRPAISYYADTYSLIDPYENSVLLFPLEEE